eukprot:g1177.t1
MSTCPNGCCPVAGGLAAPPPSGCLVRIVGLRGRADLNGKFGIVKPLDHPFTAASEKADRDREVYIKSTPGAAAKLRKIPRSQQVGICVNPETGFTLARGDPRLEMYAYGDCETDPRYPVRVLSKMKPEVRISYNVADGSADLDRDEQIAQVALEAGSHQADNLSECPTDDGDWAAVVAEDLSREFRFNFDEDSVLVVDMSDEEGEDSDDTATPTRRLRGGKSNNRSSNRTSTSTNVRRDNYQVVHYPKGLLAQHFQAFFHTGNCTECDCGQNIPFPKVEPLNQNGYSTVHSDAKKFCFSLRNTWITFHEPGDLSCVHRFRTYLTAIMGFENKRGSEWRGVFPPYLVSEPAFCDNEMMDVTAPAPKHPAEVADMLVEQLKRRDAGKGVPEAVGGDIQSADTRATSGAAEKKKEEMRDAVPRAPFEGLINGGKTAFKLTPLLVREPDAEVQTPEVEERWNKTTGDEVIHRRDVGARGPPVHGFFVRAPYVLECFSKLTKYCLRSDYAYNGVASFLCKYANSFMPSELAKHRAEILKKDKFVWAGEFSTNLVSDDPIPIPHPQHLTFGYFQHVPICPECQKRVTCASSNMARTCAQAKDLRNLRRNELDKNFVIPMTIYSTSFQSYRGTSSRPFAYAPGEEASRGGILEGPSGCRISWGIGFMTDGCWRGHLGGGSGRDLL